jgi:hypothetical protein
MTRPSASRGSDAVRAGTAKSAIKRSEVNFFKRVDCIVVPGALSGGRIVSATKGATRGSSEVY